MHKRPVVYAKWLLLPFWWLKQWKAHPFLAQKAPYKWNFNEFFIRQALSMQTYKTRKRWDDFRAGLKVMRIAKLRINNYRTNTSKYEKLADKCVTWVIPLVLANSNSRYWLVSEHRVICNDIHCWFSAMSPAVNAGFNNLFLEETNPILKWKRNKKIVSRTTKTKRNTVESKNKFDKLNHFREPHDQINKINTKQQRKTSCSYFSSVFI